MITRVSEFPVSRIQGVRNLEDGVKCLRNRLVCEASTMLAQLSFQDCQPEAGKVMRFQSVHQIPERAGEALVSHLPKCPFPNFCRVCATFLEILASFRSQIPGADAVPFCWNLLAISGGQFPALIRYENWKLHPRHPVLNSNFQPAWCVQRISG